MQIRSITTRIAGLATRAGTGVSAGNPWGPSGKMPKFPQKTGALMIDFRFFPQFTTPNIEVEVRPQPDKVVEFGMDVADKNVDKIRSVEWPQQSPRSR
jgi:hypothetical protein